jgi:hypothetical protein
LISAHWVSDLGQLDLAPKFVHLHPPRRFVMKIQLMKPGLPG